MTVASLETIKDNRYVWKTGRLSFFMITDTNYKTDDCKNDHAKLEKQIPSHVHWHHLPLSRKAKKILTSSGMRKQPRNLFMVTPTGTVRLHGEVYHIIRVLSTKKERTSIFKNKNFPPQILLHSPFFCGIIGDEKENPIFANLFFFTIHRQKGKML